MNDLVTIRRFTYPHEAMTICSRLEGEGIECVLQDQLITQVMPLYSNALGGIKLQVKESDAPAAMQILKEAGFNPEGNAPYATETLTKSDITVLVKKIVFYVFVIAGILAFALVISGLIR